MGAVDFSVVIPVYRNEDSLARLLDALKSVNTQLDNRLEAVFVVDGSPDRCYEILRDRLPTLAYPTQLLAHSRNFGSFAAIRTGLQAARAPYCGVMAADLQEPPELLVAFYRALSANHCDVAIGTRISRSDPMTTRIAARLFWSLYRRLVVKDMPEGGVDIFGCNRIFREHLLQLEESRSSLIALIFWLGFRRMLIPYERQPRLGGQSAWTFRKKVEYMMDSIFAFTDLPIRLLIQIGFGGLMIIVPMASVVLFGRLFGLITVPGYTPLMLTVLFMSALNILGLGLVGTYAWRAYENSKKRPLAVIAMRHDNRSVIDDSSNG